MRSRRNAISSSIPTAAPLSADAAAAPVATGVALLFAQQETLFAARAWWFEGDRALDYLAEQSRRALLFERLRRVLDDFRASPTAQTVRPVLLVTRQLTANRALNRTLYLDAFAQTLHDLLYGAGPLFERCHTFLQTVHVGPQTASHLLFAAFPDRYPLLSHQARTVIAPTPQQMVQARARAATVYGGDTEPAINEEAAKERGSAFAETRALLAHFALYEVVRDVLQADSFDTVHGILWHSREMPLRSFPNEPVPQAGPVAPKNRRNKNAPPSSVVRDPVQNYYAAHSNAAAANGQGESAATENDLLDVVEQEIANAGFTFAPLVVRRYYVALKAKPFVILTGLSGTGKTRLTVLFARALCGPSASENDQYLLLPVRPDWTNSDVLLGYHNLLSDQYVSTPFLGLLQKAALPEHRDRAFFVCLDEMNISPPSQYLSDVLSVMETDEKRFHLHEGHSAVLGSNVFLTGSANMDEATHPFGKKVLDRANVIEFTEVDLQGAATDAVPRLVLPPIPFLDRQRLFLSNRVTTMQAARSRLAVVDPAYSAQIIAILSALNELLTPRSMHFGYRVRDEITCYVAAAFSSEGRGLLADEPNVNLQTALDLQVMQKVLPRLTGTVEALERLLGELEQWAVQENLPRSAAKLTQMRRRANEDGFVTFYEL